MPILHAKKIFFLLLLIACTLPAVTTTYALVAGIIFSLFLENPWPQQSSAWSKNLLQISIVGLGFGLSVSEVWQVGKSSVVYTMAGIVLTLAMGTFLGRFFSAGSKTSTLIAFGTAICGGSAIAAMSPVIGSDDDETAVALATIFTLNAVALLLFPLAGHFFDLSQHQFGLWAALAIHDTSSVVGAASSFGSEALSIATTVKLVRAMWIVPVVIIFALLLKSKQKTKFPFFIVGFVITATIASFLPQYGALWNILSKLARQSLVVTLFLIGAGLSKKVLKNVGFRPMLQGLTLWLIVSGLTLTALLKSWIN